MNTLDRETIADHFKSFQAQIYERIEGFEDNKSFIKEYIGSNYDNGGKLKFNDNDPILNLALNPFFLYLINRQFFLLHS